MVNNPGEQERRLEAIAAHMREKDRRAHEMGIANSLAEQQAAEITRLRAHIDDIVPKWAAARDEIDRLRAESLEANLKLDEFQRRIWKAEADLVEARYWWGAIRTEKEDIRTRAERAEADLTQALKDVKSYGDVIEDLRRTIRSCDMEILSLCADFATITSQRDTALETIAVWRSVIYALQAGLAAAREVMTRVAGLIDSEADDPLQDAIDMARAFLERTAEDKDCVIARAKADFAAAREMAESILAFWATVAFQRNHVIPECVVKARAFLERESTISQSAPTSLLS